MNGDQSGQSIRALPVLNRGERFVWYGDCCSGIPGGAHEQTFAAVNEIVRRLDATPDVVVFAGDNIVGGAISADEFRRQWRYWLDHEMAWFHNLDIPMYHITSNHNTTNETGEAVFREVFPDVPQNGPDTQKGLSYWIRRGDFLYVFVNTNFSGLGGYGHVEHEWLDEVLAKHADAPIKIVIGHHPIFGVNGHDLYPLWRVDPEQGMPFWDVLVRHGVHAYLCSHILAFDVQVHQGVLQITTGGAGTAGMGLGLMPGAAEYHHLVQGVLDAEGLRYQVLDMDATVREWLRWLEPGLAGDGWAAFDPEQKPAIPDRACQANSADSAWIARFKVAGTIAYAADDHTIISGWQPWEGPEAIWIGIVGPSARLTVQLVPRAGLGTQFWRGPEIPVGSPFEIEIAIHSGMGPGGVLWREPEGAWSSLHTTSAQGAVNLSWPERWSLGCAQSGLSDRPFKGSKLTVSFQIATASLAGLFAE